MKLRIYSKRDKNIKYFDIDLTELLNSKLCIENQDKKNFVLWNQKTLDAIRVIGKTSFPGQEIFDLIEALVKEETERGID